MADFNDDNLYRNPEEGPEPSQQPQNGGQDSAPSVSYTHLSVTTATLATREELSIPNILMVFLRAVYRNFPVIKSLI